MCEILTICAALFCTVLYFGHRKTPALLATMLMFWGAALMWSVDCAVSAMEGEGFFDLSLDDTYLGVVILAAGFAVWAVLALRDRRRARAAA
jgi:hypothetical protein